MDLQAERFEKELPTLTDTEILETLELVILESNQLICDASRDLGKDANMGTTITTAFFHKRKVFVGHAGDSRLYLFRDKALKRLTKDHNLVQDLVDHNFHNSVARKLETPDVVTRTLGSKRDIQVDTSCYGAEPGDIFLLCSDGLSEMLSQKQIYRVLNVQQCSTKKATKQLIKLANRKGGKDNISLILTRVEAN